jgi:L-fuconolactonase
VAPDLACAAHEFVRAVVIETEAAAPPLDEWSACPKFRGLLCGANARSLAPELARRDLTLDVMSPREACDIAARFPNLRIAIDHLGLAGGAEAEWPALMTAAAEFPQVCCKLSGMAKLTAQPWKASDLQPYVRHVWTAFGPHRLMYGSGWPHCLPEYAWKETLAAFTQSIGAQPIEVREELLGGTALRFYRVKMDQQAQNH